MNTRCIKNKYEIGNFAFGKVIPHFFPSTVYFVKCSYFRIKRNFKRSLQAFYVYKFRYLEKDSFYTKIQIIIFFRFMHYFDSCKFDSPVTRLMVRFRSVQIIFSIAT